MPVYFFRCPTCGINDRRLLEPKASKGVGCRRTAGCSGVLERQVSPPTVVAKEIIDNGGMVRRVERDIDAPRLARERAEKDQSRPD